MTEKVKYSIADDNILINIYSSSPPIKHTCKTGKKKEGWEEGREEGRKERFNKHCDISIEPQGSEQRIVATFPSLKHWLHIHDSNWDHNTYSIPLENKYTIPGEVWRSLFTYKYMPTLRDSCSSTDSCHLLVSTLSMLTGKKSKYLEFICFQNFYIIPY